MIQELATERPAVRANGSQAFRSQLSAYYDALFQRIQVANAGAVVGQAIGITSCAPRAGVSTVAYNIAVTADRAECGPVLFIDADINKLPGPDAVGEVPAVGLADALSGAAQPLDCVKTVPYRGLSIVSGRGMRPHGVLTIDRHKFSEVINEYKRHFTLVVIDIPSPTELNDSVSLAGQLDGVVLVLEAERSDGRVALRTKQQLVDANANLIGVVLNKRRQHIPGWIYRRL
jgi:Mrp family chromosome partitioning ATPase